MLGSNFEKISIEVFTNRVNHTGKRWAVNNNSICLLIELQGVSKKKYILGFQLISHLKVGFYFFHANSARENLHSYLRCWTQKSLVVGVAMEEGSVATKKFETFGLCERYIFHGGGFS